MDLKDSLKEDMQNFGKRKGREEMLLNYSLKDKIFKKLLKFKNYFNIRTYHQRPTTNKKSVRLIPDL